MKKNDLMLFSNQKTTTTTTTTMLRSVLALVLWVLLPSAADAFSVDQQVNKLTSNNNNNVCQTEKRPTAFVLKAASSSDTLTGTVDGAASTTGTGIQNDDDDAWWKSVGLGLAPPISLFGKGRGSAGGADEKDSKMILGGKGSNLAEMSRIDLSVPPGFTITTECCSLYCKDEEGGGWGGNIPDEVWDEIVRSVKTIEADMGSVFGDPENPLLLSVRSGAAISMPVRRGF